MGGAEYHSDLPPLPQVPGLRRPEIHGSASARPATCRLCPATGEHVTAGRTLMFPVLLGATHLRNLGTRGKGGKGD